MKKIIFFFPFLLIVLIIAFIFTWKSIILESNSKSFNLVKSFIPSEFKTALKNTIFITPILKRTITKQTEQIEYLQTVKIQLLLNLNKETKFLGSKEIKSKFNVYNIDSYSLPFPNRRVWWKPAGYLDQNEENIFFIGGNGDFFYFSKNDIKQRNIELQKINTNLGKIIKDENFFTPGAISVKDLFLHNNLVFVSYVNDLTGYKHKADLTVYPPASSYFQDSIGCYNVIILVAKLDYNNLHFNEFFSDSECQRDSLNSDHSGGRMVYYKDDKILFTTGDMGLSTNSQNDNSHFGKIFSFDLQTGNYELISKGHRNSQGLHYDKKNDIIISTEHGPAGGDEVNVNLDPSSKIIENYGWPIASYGKPDRGVYTEEAPLHKSHKDYGFIEPIKYFTQSIGISEIINVPNKFKIKFINDFFVSSLGFKSQMIEEGDMSIHHLRFNDNFNKIIFEDIIPIGERIRDLMYVEELNKILIVLENTPILAVLDIKK